MIKITWSSNFKGVTRSSANTTTTGSVIICTKEERLSPGPDDCTVSKTNSLDVENDFIMRHDISDDRGFPSEWSYEEQFKKVSSYSCNRGLAICFIK